MFLCNITLSLNDTFAAIIIKLRIDSFKLGYDIYELNICNLEPCNFSCLPNSSLNGLV